MVFADFIHSINAVAPKQSVWVCVCVSLGMLLVGICIGLAWLDGDGLGGILCVACMCLSVTIGEGSEESDKASSHIWAIFPRFCAPIRVMSLEDTEGQGCVNRLMRMLSNQNHGSAVQWKLPFHDKRTLGSFISTVLYKQPLALKTIWDVKNLLRIRKGDGYQFGSKQWEWGTLDRSIPTLTIQWSIGQCGAPGINHWFNHLYILFTCNPLQLKKMLF